MFRFFQNYVSKLFHRSEKNKYNYKSDFIHNKLPRRVNYKDAIYNIPINRICYRGEQRRPYTKNNKGIFEIGFNNKINVDLCQKINAFGLTIFGSRNRLHTDFESNFATTYAFSTQLEAAAFFPMDDSYIPEIMLIELEENLRELGIDIDLQNEFVKFVEARSHYIPDNVDWEFENDLHEFLKLKGVVDKNQTLNETRKQFFELDTWIYIALIDKGFDVATHSILRGLQKNNFKKFGLCFAQEICSDEVPPQHIFAAYRITRDTTNIKSPSRYVITGSASFYIKSLHFNEAAIEYAKNKWHVDVDKYKKMLTDYMLANQKHNGNKIHVSEDGYYHSTFNEDEHIKAAIFEIDPAVDAAGRRSSIRV